MLSEWLIEVLENKKSHLFKVETYKKSCHKKFNEKENNKPESIEHTGGKTVHFFQDLMFLV